VTEPGNRKIRISHIGGSGSVVIAGATFVVLYALLVAASPTELSVSSINSFVVLASTLAIATIGTTLILIIGGFDLSVAGTISLTNVIAATTMAAHPGSEWLIAFLLVCLGIFVGFINGLFIVGLDLPSLGVTLATYIMLAGIALVILPAPGGFVPSSFTEVLTGEIGSVPRAGLVLVGFALLWILFKKTRTGMAVFAIGGDSEAARLSGIPVKRVQILCYSLAGGLYACAGLYFAAVTASGSPSGGGSYMLPVFAAAAVGLVSFRGGRGSVIAAMFGAGTLTVIPMLLFAMGAANFWVGVFEGLVILLALGIAGLSSRLAVKRSDSRKPTSIRQSESGEQKLGANLQ
jgi:ribose transport system permease protein